MPFFDYDKGITRYSKHAVESTQDKDDKHISKNILVTYPAAPVMMAFLPSRRPLAISQIADFRKLLTEPVE